MKFQNQLQQNKLVTEISQVDFLTYLKSISDPVLLKKIKNNLALVHVYKFFYTINKKKVAGFISLPKSGKNLPCLIHARGGSRDFGKVDERVLLQGLVRFSVEGYVVITTQYPGVGGGEGVDAFGGEDDVLSIKKLKDILKSISVANVNKIGIKGHSRGGLMAFMLLRQAQWIKCAVISSAPVDQIALAKERKGWREHQIKMWGKSKEESIKRSPIFWVDEISKKAPILLMHGSSDWRVPPTHSQYMSVRLFEVLVPHRFVLFEGADHGITEHSNECFEQTLSWFDRFLKNDESLPNLNLHGK